MLLTLLGEHIELGSEISKGGEGTVYSIEGNEEDCVKLFRKNVDLNEKHEKIKFMINSPPPDLLDDNYKICWPKKLLYENGEFVGFLMSKAFKKSEIPYHLCQTNIPKSMGQEWHNLFNRKSKKGIVSRLKLCVNIISSVNRIHSGNNYVFVDLKPQNLLVTSSGKVSVIDLDSIQISRKDNVLFKSNVSTPEYTPPEYSFLIENNHPITKDWDVFSLGVLLYEILFGLHPYVGTSLPPYDNLNTIQEKIQNGLTHISKGVESFKHLPPPHRKFYDFPNNFKILFQKIFSSNVTSRPNVEEIGGTFYKTTIQYEKKLVLETEEENLKFEKEAIKNYLSLKSKYNSLHKDNEKLNEKLKNLNDSSFKPKNSSNSNLINIFLSITLVIGVLVFFLINDSNKSLLVKKDKEIKELKNNTNLLNKLIQVSTPIIIKGVTFRSDLNGGFDGLRSNLPYRKIGFLFPTIDYYGVKEGTLNLKIKYYTPSGLSQGKNSPKGYTFETERFYNKGLNKMELTGWGNESLGSWVKGPHKIEIWNEGVILYSKSFKVK